MEARAIAKYVRISPMKVGNLYAQNSVRLPWHGINTGRKTLICQAFSDFKL